MNSFGKKIAALWKGNKMSQGELAKRRNTSILVIRRYERDETKPSIEVKQKITGYLDTTVGYLQGETEDAGLFKNPGMLQRLKALSSLPEKDKDFSFMPLTGCYKMLKL